MRAVRYHEHGGPEVLRVEEGLAEPSPGRGEVLVRVEAAGVNPVDTYFREGSYPVPELPFVPGSDLAGVVVDVGPGVERFAEGDAVFGTGLGNGRQGTYAEAALAPASFLAPLPGAVSFAEGAALALVGVTAWRALVEHAGVEPAERVLVHGASGGVGHVAVQLAATMGASVVGTASPGYHDRLADLGVDTPLDYRGDLAAELDGVAPGTVLDTRADEYLGLDTAVADDRARIVAIGNDGDEAAVAPVDDAKAKELRYQFMSMFNCRRYADRLERLGRLRVRGDVVPVVARTYDLAEAAAAQRAVTGESFLGKLVIDV